MANFGSLETFRNLEISASADAIARLGEELERVLPSSSWARNREREKDMQRSGTGSDALVFARKEDAKLPSASLSLVVRGQTASVGNIVPINHSQLSRAQYNAILEDFLTSGVRPLADKLGLKVSATDATRPLTDWLSESAAKKLKLFSDAANKSTGTSHPADYRRWLDFIVQAHRDQCALDAPLLRRWLKEVEHWPEDEAAELASDYDFGRDLLKRYSSSAE